MQRVELVAEATDAEGRRPVGGKNAGMRHPAFARERDGGRQLDDEFRMQPPDRDVHALPHHRIARGRGIDKVGLGLLDRRFRLEHGARSLLDDGGQAVNVLSEVFKIGE